MGFLLLQIVLLTLAEHLHGWLGVEHKATIHPVDNLRELCARYHIRLEDKVRQDSSRLNRISLRKLVNFVNGLGVSATHPWGSYA